MIRFIRRWPRTIGFITYTAVLLVWSVVGDRVVAPLLATAITGTGLVAQYVMVVMAWAGLERELRRPNALERERERISGPRMDAETFKRYTEHSGDRP